ncbi:AAA family ATPase [Micromonospora sp. URMC 106]|uniref:AAA family ATPase n=1 Tax=Micromonospora sp. URMC 106 TaxID=3423408 RepID=UPI003F1B20D4
MGHITKFAVEGLFHKASHVIDFCSDGPVTIIAGPNGVGKTHILRLLQAALTPNFHTLKAMPFESLEITFSNQRRLAISKEDDDEGQEQILLEGLGPKGGRIGKIAIPLIFYRTEPFDHPRYWFRTASGWINRRTGERLPSHLNPGRNLRYLSDDTPFNLDDELGDIDWLKSLIGDRNPILIDTKRLDTLPVQNRAEEPPPQAPSRINEYIEQVKLQVSDARRASLLESQAADQSFAARVLKRSRKTIPEVELKKRYEEIAERHAELHRSGLSGGAVEVEFPSSGTDATERRILTVFLNDWARKLEPFREVNDKLTALRRIVNDKFLDKKLSLDKSGALAFSSTVDGSHIPVTSLSSGEQHILALFTMLLFSAQPGSMVLIDEPEISLHAAWKHAFLTDISEVAKIADLQVVFATHSSGIVNGRWDLVRELGV